MGCSSCGNKKSTTKTTTTKKQVHRTATFNGKKYTVTKLPGTR